jgi:hypothetical protein
MIARRVLLTLLLVTGLLANPTAVGPAAACSVVGPDYTMDFEGVAIARTGTFGDSETSQFVWTFRLTKWKRGSKGVKERKPGTMILVNVAVRTPNVEPTTSCADIGVTTRYVKGATYDVRATRSGKTADPSDRWDVISYTGKLNLIKRPQQK